MNLRQRWYKSVERQVLEEYTGKSIEEVQEEYREFIKQITGIANNINQIARAVNATKYIRDEDLEYIKNTIPNFIINFEKKIYSRGDDFNGDN